MASGDSGLKAGHDRVSFRGDPKGVKPRVRSSDGRPCSGRFCARQADWLVGSLANAAGARIRRAPVTSSLSRCPPPPPAETALWAGVGGGPWVGAGIGAAGPEI